MGNSSRRVKLLPVVKWVGGKRQLLPDIEPLMPRRYNRYCEPFFGGGAVLFHLQPCRSIIGDLNGELMNMYEVIRDNVEELIVCLGTHINTLDHFYEVRNMDRDKEYFSNMSKVERAARLIFLNRTCFNGLFRVNRMGEFNSPYGHYANPNIVNADNLRAVHTFFRRHPMTFIKGDFSIALSMLKKGDFVYLDPPYDPVSDTADFTGYNAAGFNKKDQIRLKEELDILDKKGVKFMVSNSATDFILDLYQGYRQTIVKARRNINANGAKRGAVDEVVIRNYYTNKRIPLPILA